MREDLGKLCWIGRWKDLQPLWHYIQEMQSVILLQQHPEPLRVRMETMESLLDGLVAEVLVALED